MGIPKISKLKQRMIEETLEDFKCLLVRYRKYRGDDELVKEFCSRNRNPLFDITTIKYFKTGFKSNGLIENGGTPVNEHYIPRVKSTEIMFEELHKNPDMEVVEFTELIKKYSSTILITKDEHQKITQLTKRTGVMNYLVYEQYGIIVPGLREHIGY